MQNSQEGTILSTRNIHVPSAHDINSCSTVTEVLSRIGDKWSVQVVIGLRDRPRHFNELRRMIAGISQRMLTRTLRGLERDGLVRRTVVHEGLLHVDYALTDLGRSLEEPVAALGMWAVRNRQSVIAAREKFDAASPQD
ncbi:helix-turn-helix domain-containing protein [Niveispirillum sp. BGYR6]|uniref:winged helix-turn-helix transcriptional regulator n=1 Tax=Niveispirillum sp. BGYR6 TaxID=2971249 RepID=UPI0022B97C73|nr:helix-turn-helix domain-containing protein [Niveispirillum sp. BGYR6]MDG5497514.1 helix-turn-helix domain-containing protein [Niveispirillum sp. BGYR6]